MGIDAHKEGEHAVDPGFRGLVGMGRRSGGERPLADIPWTRRRAVLQSVVVARDTEATRTALKARELRLLGLFLCGRFFGMCPPRLRLRIQYNRRRLRDMRGAPRGAGAVVCVRTESLRLLRGHGGLRHSVQCGRGCHQKRGYSMHRAERQGGAGPSGSDAGSQEIGSRSKNEARGSPDHNSLTLAAMSIIH